MVPPPNADCSAAENAAPKKKKLPVLPVFSQSLYPALRGSPPPFARVKGPKSHALTPPSDGLGRMRKHPHQPDHRHCSTTFGDPLAPREGDLQHVIVDLPFIAGGAFCRYPSKACSRPCEDHMAPWLLQAFPHTDPLRSARAYTQLLLAGSLPPPVHRQALTKGP